MLCLVATRPVDAAAIAAVVGCWHLQLGFTISVLLVSFFPLNTRDAPPCSKAVALCTTTTAVAPRTPLNISLGGFRLTTPAATGVDLVGDAVAVACF